MKFCPKCKTEKDESNFKIRKSGPRKGNFRGYCNGCDKATMAAYWKTHPEKRRALKKAWRQNKRRGGPSRIKPLKPLEELLATQRRLARKSYARHRVKRISEAADWKRAHRKEINAAYRLRLQADPDFAANESARHCIKAAFKTQGVRKNTKTEKLLGCRPPAFRQFVESLFWPGMSWRNRGLWELDHIQPRASFTLSDPAQQSACFHYSNWQPLWADDNGTKSDRLDWTPHESKHSLPARLAPKPFFLPESAISGTI